MRRLRHAITTAALLVIATTIIKTPTYAAPPIAAAPASLDAATAAYVLNFLRFTEWKPPLPNDDADKPYIIGVVDNRVLLDTLIQITENQRVRSRPVRVINIRNVDDARACHVVYLEAPDMSYAPAPSRYDIILHALNAQPILTVSPAPDFLNAGGIIQLFRDNTQLKFSIDAETARQNGLSINSRLLALSRPVPHSE